MKARLLAKRALEFLLISSGAPRAIRVFGRPRTIILAYHNVVPAGNACVGDGSLHISQQSFAEHLDTLTATHDIVALDVLLSGKVFRRPTAAVTFDDAYSGALTSGLAELKARNLPATYFVAPHFLGGRSFWWDSLANSNRILDPQLRRHCLHQLAGQDQRIREWAADRSLELRTPPTWACACTEHQLHDAIENPLFTLGSHSWSHANLTAISHTQLSNELEWSYAWLRSNAPRRFLPFIAYPYGMYSEEVELAAKSAGYTAGLRITGGYLPKGANALQFGVPRFNVPSGLSADGLALRLSRLIPMPT